MAQVAIAIVRGDEPRVFIADDQETLNWVLAVELIATTPGHTLESSLRPALQSALSEERWGDAVALWMRHHAAEVDVFSSEKVFQSTDVEFAADELQFTPLFRD